MKHPTSSPSARHGIPSTSRRSTFVRGLVDGGDWCLIVVSVDRTPD